MIFYTANKRLAISSPFPKLFLGQILHSAKTLDPFSQSRIIYHFYHRLYSIKFTTFLKESIKIKKFLYCDYDQQIHFYLFINEK